MKKSTIFQGSVREPASDEDWMHASVEEKDKMIKYQANIIAILLLIIVVLFFSRY